MAVDFFALGQRIQRKRKALRKTQEDLAESLGVSVGYISQIERGIKKMSLDTLAEITGCLSCTVSELLDGAAIPSPAYLDEELAGAIFSLPPKGKRLLLEIARSVRELGLET